MEQETIIDYYNKTGIESTRLSEHSRLEGIRSKEIIIRYLHSPSLKILDIGGGTGFYSFWLQEMGHKVTLIDLSPGNIELAQRYSDSTGLQLDKCIIGNALELPFEENEFDIVLLFGPLYHLIEEHERIKALIEARRVVKEKGIVLSAVISRYASMIDGFKRDLILDDRFIEILRQDLQTGHHQNNTDNLEYFTTAYFHTPLQIENEILQSGLRFDKLIAVEGLGWLLRDFPVKEKNAQLFENILQFIRSAETSKEIIGASPHIIAVAQK